MISGRKLLCAISFAAKFRMNVMSLKGGCQPIPATGPLFYWATYPVPPKIRPGPSAPFFDRWVLGGPQSLAHYGGLSHSPIIGGGHSRSGLFFDGRSEEYVKSAKRGHEKTNVASQFRNSGNK